jgi:hypothetical protein
MILYQFPLHRKLVDNSGEKLPNRNKKLLDNLRQSPYHSIVGVLGLKLIFNLVLSDKSTV